MMKLKRPESVLVVVYTSQAEVLLLQRRTPPVGIWQSVTGALLWGEDAPQAAARELYEETGIEAAGRLRRHAMINRFPILPEVRHCYAPGVEENIEYVFSLPLAGICPIRLDPREHDAFGWFPLDQAIARMWSWSNRAAVERLVGGINNA